MPRITLSLALFVSLFVAQLAALEPTGPWWDSAWSERLKVTFRQDPAEDLQGFPVLVRLSSARFAYAASQSDGDDLRFIAQDGMTILPHEVEQWVPDGESLIWVRIPQISSAGNNHFWLYYGNPGAPSIEDQTDVWGNDYFLVQHFSGDLADSSASGTTTAGQGDSIGPATIGQGLAIETGILNTTADEAPQVLTFSCWVNWSGGDSSFPRLFQKQDGTGSEAFLFINNKHSSGPVGALRLQDHGSWSGTAGGDYWSAATLPKGWTWVVMTQDRSTPNGATTYFFDGVQVGTDSGRGHTANGLFSPGNKPYNIANRLSLTRAYRGDLDELRFARVARSPDWVRLQYLGMTDALLDYVGRPLQVAWPSASVTSPVNLAVSYSPDSAIAATTSIGTNAGINLTTESVAVDADLVAGGATEITVTAGDGTSTTAFVTWTSTPLAGQSLMIRSGDSLLVSLPPTTSSFTRSDASGATESLSVQSESPVAFPLPGTYTLTAVLADGTEQNATITAVGVQFPDAIAAQLHYERNAVVRVHPAGALPAVTLSTNDQALVSVGLPSLHGSLSDFDEAVFSVKPNRRGVPQVLARLGPEGPLLAVREVGEYTLEDNLRGGFVKNSSTGMGGGTIVMRPLVDGLRVEFDMFSHSSTFSGGATVLSVSSGDFTSEDDPDFVEPRGVYFLAIEQPEDENNACYRTKLFQTVTFAGPIGLTKRGEPGQKHQFTIESASGSAEGCEEQAGDNNNTNSKSCDFTCEDLSICMGEIDKLKITTDGDSEKDYKVEIVKNCPNDYDGDGNVGANEKTWSATADAGFITEAQATAEECDPRTQTTQIDCEQTVWELPVCGGSHCEKYDIVIGGVTFSKCLQVTKDLTLDINFNGPLAAQNLIGEKAAKGRGDATGPLTAGPATGILPGNGDPDDARNLGPNITHMVEIRGCLCPGAPQDGYDILQDAQGREWRTKADGTVEVDPAAGENPEPDLTDGFFGPVGAGAGHQPNDNSAFGKQIVPDLNMPPKIYLTDTPGLAPPIIFPGTVVHFRQNLVTWAFRRAFNKAGWDEDCDPLVRWHAVLTAYKKQDGTVVVIQPTSVGWGHVSLDPGAFTQADANAAIAAGEAAPAP